MTLGRPVKSIIRQRIVEILAVLKKAYGYEICKVYKEVYPKATMRVIYYPLKKGLATHEFAVDKIVKERGEYSWGSEAEKIYYTLGAEAKPVGDDRIMQHLQKRKNNAQ